MRHCGLPETYSARLGSGLGKLNCLNQDKAVELLGGATRERERLERRGEEGTHSHGEPKPFVRTAQTSVRGMRFAASVQCIVLNPLSTAMCVLSEWSCEPDTVGGRR